MSRPKTVRIPITGQCHYCPAPATTRDHIVPLSEGGRNQAWNLVCACRKCNSRKGSRLPTCGCQQCREARSRHGLLEPVAYTWPEPDVSPQETPDENADEWILPEFAY